MHMFLTNIMEKHYFGSKPQQDEFERTLKAKISRENTNSRRFSASNLKNENSCRSNITISSTIRDDEINPSTYSFTTALKALQAKRVHTWEYISPDDHGITLNSKWNEAEKYICNPLSGQVPLECLSSKTLSERWFRSRITMSAPLLIYHPCQVHHIHAKSPIVEHRNEVKITTQDMKRSDVGTQSTEVDLSSIKQSEPRTDQDSAASVSTKKPISGTKEVEVMDKKEKQEEYRKRNERKERNKVMKMLVCSSHLWSKLKGAKNRGGCLCHGYGG